MWVLNDMTIDGNKILPVVWVLPDNKSLKEIDRAGKFDCVIMEDLVRLTRSLQGVFSPYVKIRRETYPLLENDYDELFLYIHKKYSHSTHKYAILLGDKESCYELYMDKILAGSVPRFQLDYDMCIKRDYGGIDIRFTYNCVKDELGLSEYEWIKECIRRDTLHV